MSEYEDGIEAAAVKIEELARGCRNIAETIRREWCGPDCPAVDRKANYVDARDHDKQAGVYEQIVPLIRGLKMFPRPSAAHPSDNCENKT